MTAAILRIQRRTFASLGKHRNYRLYFFGQLVSASGTWMQQVALAWFVIELTDSPIAVGALAFARFAPFTVLGLFSGVVADRVDNRRLMMVTQSAQMVVAATLAALAFTGVAELWHLYALAAIGGTAHALDSPSRHALTYQLVGRDELPNAVALNSSLFNSARIFGPGLGGLVIGAFGVATCFALNAVSFLAVLAALALMRREELFPLHTAEEPPTVFRGIREALSWVRRSPAVRLVLATTIVLSTVGVNFHVLVPVLASATLHTGAEVFGVLSATFGAGALFGALLAASLGRASWKALVGGTAGFGFALLALAAQASVPLSAGLLFVTGVCFTMWTANSQSIVQLSSPDHLRGRLVGLYMFAFAGLTPIGGLFAGWLAEVGGTKLAFGVSGAVGVLLAGLAARELRGGPPQVRREEPQDRLAAELAA